MVLIKMMMPITTDSGDIKEKLLANPKRVLSIAKNMGVDVTRVERIYDDLVNDSFLGDEWFGRLEDMVDLAVNAIIDALKMEFRKQGLEEFDVEKYFLNAMLELKRGTAGSIRKAQDYIKIAKMEAKRQENMKKGALRTIYEIETLLKETKEVDKAWAPENEYTKMESSLKEILGASERRNYELAQFLANAALERVKELRDVKYFALRYAAKSSHIVGKVKSEKLSPSLDSNENIIRLNTLLSTIKHFLEQESYQTALLLAKEVKNEAEKLLPSDKTRISNYICPLCFSIDCPNPYCNLSISPSPLLEETCRTYCNCGTLYHICCVQKGNTLICASCRNPLKG